MQKAPRPSRPSLSAKPISVSRYDRYSDSGRGVFCTVAAAFAMPSKRFLMGLGYFFYSVVQDHDSPKKATVPHPSLALEGCEGAYQQRVFEAFVGLDELV